MKKVEQARLTSLPPPETAPESQARLERLSSHVAEIRRGVSSSARIATSSSSSDPSAADERKEDDDDVVPEAMPSGWSRPAHILVEVAVHYVVTGQLEAARREALDACVLLDMLDADLHDAGCKLSVMLGDVLLATHEPVLARDRFERAVIALDERAKQANDDTQKSEALLLARARVGLAHALLALKDPAARAALEDAGTAFEELGDEEAARAIDDELRTLSADVQFRESSRSFHSASVLPSQPNLKAAK